MTANNDRRGDGGSRARRPFPARARLLAVIAALAAVLLAAGCGSAGSSSPASASGTTASASAAATSGTTTATPAGSAAPGTDIGLTATTIKVGMIADVDTSLAPGCSRSR